MNVYRVFISTYWTDLKVTGCCFREAIEKVMRLKSCEENDIWKVVKIGEISR